MPWRFPALKLRQWLHSLCRGAAHDLLGSMPVIVGRAFQATYTFPQQSRDGADTVLVASAELGSMRRNVPRMDTGKSRSLVRFRPRLGETCYPVLSVAFLTRLTYPITLVNTTWVDRLA